MAVKRVEIKGFKKLVDFSADFEQTNIIVGENNSGKTTLLQILKSALQEDATQFEEYRNNNPEVVWSFLIIEEYKSQQIQKSLKNTSAPFKWSKKVIKKSLEKYENPICHFVEAQENIRSLMEDLSRSMAKMIESEQEGRDALNIIKKYIRKIEARHNYQAIKTKSITEDNDDYSWKIDLDLSNALKITFKDEKNSILSKGLGQQKEFMIRLFSKSNSAKDKNTVLLIDELENSLSQKSLISLVKGFYVEDNKNLLAKDRLQVIFTTHNPQSIQKENEPNIIIIGDKMPIEMLEKIDNPILCEGIRDSKVFKGLFPKKTFWPSGGNNIVSLAKAIIDSGGVVNAIVDGDKSGSQYIKRMGLSSDKVNMLKLKKGTIEDYYSESDKIKAINKIAPNKENILEKFPNNFLNSKLFGFTKIEKEKIKNELAKSKIDIQLKVELGSFIKKCK